MDEVREEIGQIVRGISPLDALEARHQQETLAWIAGGAGLFRTAKPATPPRHLVSYAVAVDHARSLVLLIDHRLSGLWLPTGGHVEVDEHPAKTARRELQEEVGVAADHLGAAGSPLMITVTETVGRTAGHTDVSLWYPFAVDADARLEPDSGEMVEVRWWPFDDVAHGPGSRFDPHLPRFLAKARALLSPRNNWIGRAPDP
jgi:8-oxo-dGTP diphosphatase